MKRRILPLMASLCLLCPLAVSADDYLSREEIVNSIWSDWWVGVGDDGTSYPEASYKHHILVEWVEENVEEDYYTSASTLKYNFKQWYRDLIADWDFEDDDDGCWTITTSETTYHFTYQNGTWLMCDANGDVVDRFEPYSTASEEDDIYSAEYWSNYYSASLEDSAVTSDEDDDSTVSYTADSEDSTSSNRVGANVKIESTADSGEVVTESEEVSTAEETSSASYLLIGIGIAIVIGVAILGGMLIKGRSKS